MNIKPWRWPQVWERDVLEPEIILTDDFDWAAVYMKKFVWKPVDDVLRVPAWHPILVETNNRTFANIRFEAYDETTTELTPLEKKREAKANIVKFCNEKRNREWRALSFG